MYHYPASWTAVFKCFLLNIDKWQSAEDIAMQLDNQTSANVRRKLMAWEKYGVLEKRFEKEGNYRRAHYRLIYSKGQASESN